MKLSSNGDELSKAIEGLGQIDISGVKVGILFLTLLLLMLSRKHDVHHPAFILEATLDLT